MVLKGKNKKVCKPRHSLSQRTHLMNVPSRNFKFTKILHLDLTLRKNQSFGYWDQAQARVQVLVLADNKNPRNVVIINFQQIKIFCFCGFQEGEKKMLPPHL